VQKLGTKGAPIRGAMRKKIFILKVDDEGMPECTIWFQKLFLSWYNSQKTKSRVKFKSTIFGSMFTGLQKRVLN